MDERVCKYCGTKLHPYGDICATCRGKLKVLVRFAEIRNELRRKTNLPPMQEVDAK